MSQTRIRREARRFKRAARRGADEGRLRLVLRFLGKQPIAVGWVVLLIALAVCAPHLTHQDPYAVHVVDRFRGVSWTHLFGTDEYGRDVFTRVAVGTGFVFYVIALCGLLSAALGSVLGLVAGYFGKIPDLLLSRIVDAIQSFPPILIGIMLAAAIRPSLDTAILATALFATPELARVVRGEVLRIREEAFIEASRAIGASHVHILVKGILPNVLPAIVVQISSSAPRAVIAVAGLSFLGLGAQPPIPDWGAMIYQANSYLYEHPLYLITVTAMLSVTVIVLNLIGDTTRDLLARKQARF